ncbi:hypothetical protein F5X99DRAFT_430474 [Biscogniauxia marginata]|nr:hypothetical protein F5X99DRAFT_430474 [Biscogniauxia marginata]
MVTVASGAMPAAGAGDPPTDWALLGFEGEKKKRAGMTGKDKDKSTRRTRRRGRGITLLGDAAHLMTPFAGAGADVALIAALELAGEIVGLYEEGMFKRSARDAANTATAMEMQLREDGVERLLEIVSGGRPEVTVHQVCSSATNRHAGAEFPCSGAQNMTRPRERSGPNVLSRSTLTLILPDSRSIKMTRSRRRRGKPNQDLENAVEVFVEEVDRMMEK